MTSDAARELAAASTAARREEVERRRAQVAILRLARPAISAEELARLLGCSPATVRGDLRALRARQKSA